MGLSLSHRHFICIFRFTSARGRPAGLFAQNYSHWQPPTLRARSNDILHLELNPTGALGAPKVHGTQIMLLPTCCSTQCASCLCLSLLRLMQMSSSCLSGAGQHSKKAVIAFRTQRLSGSGPLTLSSQSSWCAGSAELQQALERHYRVLAASLRYLNQAYPTLRSGDF